MLYALAPLHNLHTVTWQTELALTLNIILSTPHPPRAPALPTDPSLSMEILSAALHAGPDVYHKAVAAWHAKFPVSGLPDPGKDFVICEGSSGRHDQRMRGPANFRVSRSFAEFMAGWLRADISYDKGDRLLEVATNVREKQWRKSW